MQAARLLPWGNDRRIHLLQPEVKEGTGQGQVRDRSRIVPDQPGSGPVWLLPAETERGHDLRPLAFLRGSNYIWMPFMKREWGLEFRLQHDEHQNNDLEIDSGDCFTPRRTSCSPVAPGHVAALDRNEHLYKPDSSCSLGRPLDDQISRTLLSFGKSSGRNYHSFLGASLLHWARSGQAGLACSQERPEQR